jgi:hypothetical protein
VFRTKNLAFREAQRKTGGTSQEGGVAPVLLFRIFPLKNENKERIT